MTNPKVENPFVFQKVSELPPAEALSTCIYGASGTGKTDMAGSAPRPLIINTGNGEETLKGPSFKERRKADPIIVTITEAQVRNAWTGFYKVGDCIDYALETMGDQFDTVVLDDLTTLNKFGLNTAVDMNGDSGRSNTKATYAKRNVYLPAMQDFGTQMGLIDWFFGTYIPILKQAKKHFIVLAHERWSYTKPKGKGDVPQLIGISPHVTGADKNPDGLAGYFDNVWRTTKVNGEIYRVITQGDEVVRAKTRTGGTLNVKETNPDFSEMLSRMQSGKLLVPIKK